MVSSFLRLSVAVAWCLAFAGPAFSQQALIIVRHAEKADQTTDTHLSEAGQARARALAVLLAQSGASAIYATEYTRTTETVKPLADLLGLPIQHLPAADTSRLIERLRTRHAQETVVVVGHSNTVPEILKLYGISIPPIGADDFGNVFVVVPKPDRSPVLLRLRY
jgi:broad specificity phosphatase PhoE